MTAAREVYVADRAALHRWFAAHHSDTEGIWIVFDKGPARTVDQSDVMDEAVCYGWIDSRVRGRDDGRTSLYVTPRSPRSRWSPTNRERVARLIATGRMHPPGLAAVDAAKASGRWE